MTAPVSGSTSVNEIEETRAIDPTVSPVAAIENLLMTANKREAVANALGLHFEPST